MCNPFRYRGYVYDGETGLYYLRSRYYNPARARFLNADGYVQTLIGDLTSANIFSYCSGSPINNFDPVGDFALTATLGGIALWKIGAFGVGVVAAIAITDTLVKDSPGINAKPKVETRNKAKDVAPQSSLRKDPVHHIVAQADHRAAESRQILREVGIEPIMDPRNLVILPQRYHASLHTAAYHNYVTERLKLVAGNKTAVETTLNSLRAEILIRSAAGIRWD